MTIVLQECHNHSAIRHASVALGALYKTLEMSSEPPTPESSVGNPLQHWEMALRQYSRSINAITSTENTEARTVLMVSALLVCFDSFTGNHKQAVTQVQKGWLLFQSLQAEHKNTVEPETVQILTRLAIQAKQYDRVFHFSAPFTMRLTYSPLELESYILPENIIPETFSSLSQPRSCWDLLSARTFSFIESLLSFRDTSTIASLPVPLPMIGATMKKENEKWSEAFDSILVSRTATGVAPEERAGISALKMVQMSESIAFQMTFNVSEMHWDNFRPQFKTIVDLALEIVGDEERRAAAVRCPDPTVFSHRSAGLDAFSGHNYIAHHVKPSFSAALGIVMPLFMVATKCRNPLLRRQAIALLRLSSRREGMWDSELAARIGMWIAEVEEEEDEVGLKAAEEYTLGELPSGSRPPV